jgi:hypothetical protein
MDSTDAFGFKVERTSWLMEEVVSSLANYIDGNTGLVHSPSKKKLIQLNPTPITSMPLSDSMIKQVLKNVSEILADL